MPQTDTENAVRRAPLAELTRRARGFAGRVQARREQARDAARDAIAEAAARLDHASHRLSGRLSAIAVIGLGLLTQLTNIETARMLSEAAPSRSATGRPASPLSAAAPGVEIVPTRRLDLAGMPLAPSVDAVTTAGTVAAEPAPVRLATAGLVQRDSGLTPADMLIHVARRSSEPGGAAAKTPDKSAADKVTTGSTSDDKPLPVPPASAPTEPQPEAWSEADIAEARQQCARVITGLPLEGEEAAPVRNGACGTPAPITLKKAGAQHTELMPSALVNCRMAAALNGWIDDVLQPAARDAFGQPVVRILTASSYVCRNRYGAQAAPISEHAFANALDISGFVLGDGRVVKVVDGWGPSARDGGEPEAAKGDGTKPETAKGDKAGAAKSEPADKKPKRGAAQAAAVEAPTASASGAFLRKLHKGACATFGTVLGPDANEAHRDHLHFDLKQRRAAHICD